MTARADVGVSALADSGCGALDDVAPNGPSGGGPSGGGEVLDVVGIGFGPANLAVAVVLEELAESGTRLRAAFVESKPAFSWHPGMMLPGANMQIAFPKDLATMRNPRSAYTFFNYLHNKGRMVDFINQQTFFPSRHEFGDYLAWAANSVDADVRYGTRAACISFDGDHVVVSCDSADGPFELRARNVLFAPGLVGRMPDGIATGDRIFHNHDILDRLGGVPSMPNGAFAVLGAGQSAAEVVEYLHSTYPDSRVHLLHTKFGLSPSDDSPFANRVFDPDTVDLWSSAPADVRERLMDYHRSTNYSAVDMDLLEELYRREYHETVTGTRRLIIHRTTEVVGVDGDHDGVTLGIRNLMTGGEDTIRVDALVCATGFSPGDIRDLLGDAASAGVFEAGRPVVGRDYRLATTDTVRAGVYLNGGVENTHGLSSTLLSNIAVRAGEIIDSVVARRAVTDPRFS